jgi:SSS family solute:Na+ symporter
VDKFNGVTMAILLILFLAVTVTGFAAARWRKAEDSLHLNEWGLGGRSFGTFISWFMLGGDVYTAYTFIAVPAVIFGSASAGFFTVAYTAMVYPIAIIFLPRMWSIARVHNYVTPADFIRGRYGSRSLALAVTLTGILALMPYIALQLVGIESVLDVMGITGNTSSTIVKDIPLFIAFAVLAVFTYVSGLRAPALISFVKDILVYIFILVAVLYIPTRIGGYGHIFSVAQAHFAKINPTTKKPTGAFLPTGLSTGQLSFMTLALGSACALFCYPHTITGALASKRRYVVKRNMSLLPFYSLMLGLIALLGYVAIATPAVAAKTVALKNTQLSVPLLMQNMFPSWFVGVAFAAIIIGALVPAAVMSIAAANLVSRNIFKEFFRPDASPALETKVSQGASLVVKIGALAFAVGIGTQFAINLQLLGGVWILQTFPALVGGLFCRWFHKSALLVGWAAGMAFGTLAAYNVRGPAGQHFFSSTDILFNWHIYIGVSAFLINIVLAVVLTPIFRTLGLKEGADETLQHQYTADPVDYPAAQELLKAAVGAEISPEDIKADTAGT